MRSLDAAGRPRDPTRSYTYDGWPEATAEEQDEASDKAMEEYDEYLTEQQKLTGGMQ
jgi:hypothetical protein